jgi:hypothetical protein
MEKDDEVKGLGNSLDYSARLFSALQHPKNVFV